MNPSKLTIRSLFPKEFHELLTATGQHFVERVGPTLVRQAVLRVLQGHNVRTQTEPLTRQRIAEVSGALVAMFIKGRNADPEFYNRLSKLAASQLKGPRAQSWPAQWSLGLTGKGVQNVLRSNDDSLAAYVDTFEGAIAQAAANLESTLGPLDVRMAMGSHQRSHAAPLGWTQVLRLTTALGCAELAVRGSDKSRYGKLFERLVLGSVLSILGFNLSERTAGHVRERTFWLSDSTDDRECDATAIIAPGRVARFDIGFIGRGNPEIVRDKLSRFAREVEQNGRRATSQTFVIIDHYPTGKNANTREIAEKSGTAILQMSMSFWPRELAKELHQRAGYSHPLAKYNDARAAAYIETSMAKVDVLKFARGVMDGAAESDIDDDQL